MYDDKYYFITFTFFLSLLSGFGFEIIIFESDPIRILGLVFVFKSDPFVKNWIGFSGTIYSPNRNLPSLPPPPFHFLFISTSLLSINGSKPNNSTH